ncbi:MAG: glutamine-hydrolyzing synthase, partial [Bacteroidota bacterium]
MFFFIYPILQFPKSLPSLPSMTEKILILDFGSQYTQLIARAVREANVYCEIVPYHKNIEFSPDLKGVILSGSPFSVNDPNAPEVDIKAIAAQRNVLGICYGAQLTAKSFGGRVERSEKREYGRAILQTNIENVLLASVPETSQVWMSHGDSILELPHNATLLATTNSIPIAAFKVDEPGCNEIFGLQFHPEVYHSEYGKKIIQNFLYTVCGCSGDWTPAHFITDTVEVLKKQIGDKKVVMALSGGVDSTVAATLIHRAIGKNLFGIFVDNGVLRKDEFEAVLKTYEVLDLNVKGVDAKHEFYGALNGLSNPEEKRKAIGRTFIEIFDQEAQSLTDISFLG